MNTTSFPCCSDVTAARILDPTRTGQTRKQVSATMPPRPSSRHQRTRARHIASRQVAYSSGGWDDEPGDRGPRRRRGPGRGGDERAPECWRRAARRLGARIASPSGGAPSGGTPWSPTGPRWHDRFPGLEFATSTPMRSRRRSRSPTTSSPTRRSSRARSGAASRSAPCGRTPAARLPRRDLGWQPRRPLRCRRDRSVPASGDPAVVPARLRLLTRSTPAPTATRSNSPTVACSWSAPGRRGCRSPTSCRSRAGRCTSPSARTTGRRAATAGATSSGGSESSASGKLRRLPLGAEHVTIAVSGAQRRPHRRLPRPRRQRHQASPAGPLRTSDGTIRFAPDLGDNIAHGDASYLSLLDEADAYIARNGLDFPRSRRLTSLVPTRSA